MHLPKVRKSEHSQEKTDDLQLIHNELRTFNSSLYTKKSVRTEQKFLPDVPIKRLQVLEAYLSQMKR